MRALRAFSSMDAMADFHAPFRSWPASAHPLDWSYEGTIEAIYTACLQPGDAAIDGGANQGRRTPGRWPGGCSSGVSSSRWTRIPR